MDRNIKILLSVIVVLWIGLMTLMLIPSRTVYVRQPDTVIIINAVVTMYNSDPAQTDETPTITASGELVGDGTIACPAKLPFGTEVKIKGKTYTCNDRMGARYRHADYFDIWVPDYQTAISHGRQKMEVEVYPQEALVRADRP